MMFNRHRRRNRPRYEVNDLPNLYTSSTNYIKTKDLSEKDPSEILPLTIDELDQIDEVSENIIQDFEKIKIQTNRKIEESQEKIKNQFLILLNSVYEEVFDLLENHSKYAKFNRLVSIFQDSKFEYETEPNVSNADNLLENTKNLFLLNESKSFNSLIDFKSIDKSIDKTERLFKSIFSTDKKNCSNYPNFSNFINKKKISDDSLSKAISLINIDIFRDSERKNEESLEEKMFVLDKDLDLLRIKNKIIKKEKKTKKEKIEFANEMLEYLNKNKTFDNSYIESCAHVKDSLFLINYFHKQEDSMYNNNMDKTNTNLVLKDFSLLNKRSSINGDEHLSKLVVPGKVSEIVVCPNKTFLGIKRANNNSLIYKLSNTNLILLDDLKNYSIKDLLFVNSEENPKLFFLNSHGHLHCYNLKNRSIEVTTNFISFKSIHYVDQKNIFLITKNIEFGLYSVVNNCIVNLVNIELEETEQRQSEDFDNFGKEYILLLFFNKKL